VIIIKKIVFNFLIFLILFFMFDTSEIDSNSEYLLIYDKKNLYEESYYTVYFKNMNIYNIGKILNTVDINVLSYVINDKKYYVSNDNINDLINQVTINKSDEDKIYYELNGFNIDAINIVCETQELIKLEKIADIY